MELRSRMACCTARVGLLLAIAVPALAQQSTPAFSSDELLIKFREGSATASKQGLLAAMAATELDALPSIGAALYRVPDGQVQSIIGRYASDPRIEWIEPNYWWTGDGIPSDHLFHRQWPLQNIGQDGGTAGADISAAAAWDLQSDASDVLVAVIDSGISFEHPDLIPNIFTNPGEIAANGVDDDANGFIDDVHGWNFAYDSNNPYDDLGHGTHVSGTIGAAGNDGFGVAGVAWSVSLLPIKFLAFNGFGSTADAISAIEYATLMGADILNNSWGSASYSEAMREAIAAATSAGAIFVASAGNASVDNDVYPHYPSSFTLPGIISVAATDRNDGLGYLSNYGLNSVDIGAPGIQIYSTVWDYNFAWYDGTSMAAPHVSGTLALMLAHMPELTGSEAIAKLLASVDPLPSLAGRVSTGGRLNAARALADLDNVAPDPIEDLEVLDVASSWLNLQWTASGDDGSVGRASGYRILYSTEPFSAEDHGSASSVSAGIYPGEPGETESARLSGLISDTSYYVGVLTQDDSFHEVLSNLVFATTLPAPTASLYPLSVSASLLTGGHATRTVNVENIGHGVLDFRIATPNMPAWLTVQPLSGSLGSGASSQLELQLDATGLAGGSYEADLLVTTNDPQSAQLIISVLLTTTSAADIRSSSDEIDFGEVYVGQTEVRSLELRNFGYEELNLIGYEISDAEFTLLTQLPASLGSGQDVELQLQWAPMVAQPRASILSIQSDDPDQPILQIGLRGTALDPPIISMNPLSDEVELPTGAQLTRFVEIGNLGGSMLDVSIRIEKVGIARSSTKHDRRTAAELEEFASHLRTTTRATQAPFPPPSERVTPSRPPLEAAAAKLSPDGLEVLILHSSQLTHLLPELLAEGGFARLDAFDASDAVPTDEDLDAYDVVMLVFALQVDQRELLGDRLADYVDRGGGVVETGYSITTGAYVRGRWLSDGYSPFLSSFSYGDGASLGEFDRTHPAMYGVDAMSAWRLSELQLRPGAELVASYKDTSKAVATKGSSVIAVNASYDWEYGYALQAIKVLSNACGWAAGTASWLSVEPLSMQLAVGSFGQMDLNIEPREMFGGNHFAELRVESNDPINPRLIHTLNMHLIGQPDLGVDRDPFVLAETFLTTTRRDSLQLRNVGTDFLAVESISIEDSQFTVASQGFLLEPGEARWVVVDFEPTQAGPISTSLRVVSNDADQPERWIGVESIGVDPPVLVLPAAGPQVGLDSDQQALQSVIVHNGGLSDLHWSLAIRSGGNRSLSETPLEDMKTEYERTQASTAGFIPDRYQFSGGVQGTYINSGTGGPFIVGNRIRSSLSGTELPYSNGLIRSAPAELGAGGRYFTRKFPGMFLFGAELDGVAQISFEGNIPSDAGAQVQLRSFVVVIDGHAYRAFTRQVFGGSLPSVNHLVIVPDGTGAGHTHVNSATSQYHRITNLTTTKRLLYLLFTGNGGRYYDEQMLSGLAQQLLRNLRLEPSWLDIQPTSGVVGGGGSQQLTAAFDATGIGSGGYEADVVFASNDPHAAQAVMLARMDVEGFAELSIGIPELQFDPVQPGETDTKSLSIQNLGSDMLQVGSISTVEPHFSVDPALIELAPWESAEIAASFAPDAIGTFSGTLDFQSNDWQSPLQQLPVIGIGANPPIFEISPAELSVSLRSGEQQEHSIAIGNRGEAVLRWTGLIDRAQIDQSSQAKLANLRALRVYLDRSKGGAPIAYYQSLVADLRARGAEVVEGSAQLTAELLEGYDLLWISAPGAGVYSAAQALAIAEFVGSGNGLLLDAGQTSHAVLGPLVQTLELPVQTSAISQSLSAGPIQAHPITQDVQSVVLSLQYMLLQPTSPRAQNVLVDNLGRGVLCALGERDGRVVLMSSSLLRDGFIASAQNRQLSNQVFDWLLGQDFLAMVSESGTVQPGADSESITLRIDAQGMLAGTYENTLRLETNDPQTAELLVPVQVHIEGVPAISVGANHLELGELVIGSTHLPSVVVVNLGTGALIVSSITSESSDVTSESSSLELAPFVEQELVLRVSPTSLGSFHASVDLHTNDPLIPIFELQVSAEVIPAPDIRITPEAIALDLNYADLVEEEISLWNLGESRLDWSASVQRLRPADEVNQWNDLLVLGGAKIQFNTALNAAAISTRSTVVASLVERGAVVSGASVLSSTLLSEHDVLWIASPTRSPSQAERSIIAQFVSNGGSLLVEGDTPSSVSIYGAMATATASGITLSSVDLMGGESSAVQRHRVTDGVESVSIDHGSASLTVQGPARLVVHDLIGRGAAAVSNSGAGRVFITTANLFTDAQVGMADNLRLATRALDWLVVPDFISVEPTMGALEDGIIPARLLVQFDCDGLLPGAYAADLLFESNDPDQPQLVYPLSVGVTGVARIAAEPEVVDFGEIIVTSSTHAEIVLRSVGVEPLEIQSINVDVEAAQVESWSGFLAPMESRQVAVDFQAQQLGTIEGRISVSCNDPDRPLFEIPLLANVVPAPEISIEPDSVYAVVGQGQVTLFAVVLRNQGGSALNWSGSFETPGLPWISMQEPSGSVPAGAIGAATIRLSGVGRPPGRYETTLLLAHNDPSRSTIAVPVRMDIDEQPRLTVIPGSIDVGQAMLDAQIEKTIQLRNGGSSELVISAVIPTVSTFRVEPPTLVVPAYDVIDAVVHFDPTHTGYETGMLSFVSNSPDSPDLVPVYAQAFGSGRLGQTPTQLTLVAAPGGIASKALRLENLGDDPLTVEILSSSNKVGQQGAEEFKRASGGPDLYGHGWRDSDSAGGPEFEWLDIGIIGRAIALGQTADNVTYGPFALEVPFEFFGTQHNTFMICTNGWISFTSNATSAQNTVLPSNTPTNPSIPRNLLAVFWDDLIGGSAYDSKLHYKSVDGKLIVQFTNFRQASDPSGPGHTFQVVLRPDGSILYNYLQLGPQRSGCTVGFQNATTNDGLTIAHEQPYLHDQMAVQIGPFKPWLSVQPSRVELPGQSAVDVQLHADGSGLGPGQYTGKIVVLTSEFDRPIVQIGAELRLQSVFATQTVVLPNRIIPGNGSQPFVVLLELPPAVNPATIDVTSVRLSGAVAADPTVPPLGDFNGNGRADLRFEFERAASEALLVHDGTVYMATTGVVEGVTAFVGLAPIQVILPYLVGPQPGAILEAGTTIELSWAIPEGWPVAHVALHYSLDGGVSWAPIVTELDPSESYAWQLPAVDADSAMLRVYYFDSESAELGYDSSDGTFEIRSAPTAIEPALTQPYLRTGEPNPFRSSTTLSFGLTAPTHTRLRVFDSRGRQVAILIDELWPAGRHTVEWTGHDSSGKPVASGVYFYRLEAGEFEATRRITYLP